MQKGEAAHFLTSESVATVITPTLYAGIHSQTECTGILADLVIKSLRLSVLNLRTYSKVIFEHVTD